MFRNNHLLNFHLSFIFQISWKLELKKKILIEKKILIIFLNPIQFRKNIFYKNGKKKLFNFFKGPHTRHMGFPKERRGLESAIGHLYTSDLLKTWESILLYLEYFDLLSFNFAKREKSQIMNCFYFRDRASDIRKILVFTKETKKLMC